MIDRLLAFLPGFEYTDIAFSERLAPASGRQLWRAPLPDQQELLGSARQGQAQRLYNGWTVAVGRVDGYWIWLVKWADEWIDITAAIDRY